MKVDSVRLEEMLRESRAIYETFCSVRVSNALAILWADMAASLLRQISLDHEIPDSFHGFFCEFLH